jgi:hypothetical protein
MDEDEDFLGDDNEIDGLFDWAVSTFSSGGTNLTQYTATLNQGTVTTVSNGKTTINLEANND